MSTTISKYYRDELKDWIQAIQSYGNEINVFAVKLNEVIRRNSIVGIAQKVEAFQLLLNRATDRFSALHQEIEQQGASLGTDSTLIDDSSVSDAINQRQLDLRKNMHDAEKQYVDVKFACYNFLSETLRKKSG